VFRRLLSNIARALDRHGIPYMIIGGQALLLYGEPRLTKDIDVTLGVGVEGFVKVKTAIEELGLRMLPEDPEGFLHKTLVLPAIEESSGIRVDFIFSFSVYERKAIERARPVKLGDISVNFASLEDLIIHKVVAGRARDVEDIKSILLKTPKYDETYISKWLAELDASLGEHYTELYRNLKDEFR
jgi:predicted nucleotidyltransferase